MELYGLTGGIGSGKSAVAAILQEHNVPVLFADLLAREVVAPGSMGLAQIVDAFGPQALGADGQLDRAAVAKAVFADPERRKQLEAIVHPRIVGLLHHQLAELARQGHKRCVYEVPLLFEQNRERDFVATIVVCAPMQARIDRVITRDGLPIEQIKARIAAQLDDHEKRERATFVIDNDGTIDDLRAQVERVLGWLWRDDVPLPPQVHPRHADA